MPLLLWLFSMLPSVKLKVGCFLFFLLFFGELFSTPATLDTIAYIHIIYVLSNWGQSLYKTHTGKKLK